MVRLFFNVVDKRSYFVKCSPMGKKWFGELLWILLFVQERILQNKCCAHGSLSSFLNEVFVHIHIPDSSVYYEIYVADLVQLFHHSQKAVIIS